MPIGGPGRNYYIISPTQIHPIDDETARTRTKEETIPAGARKLLLILFSFDVSSPSRNALSSPFATQNNLLHEVQNFPFAAKPYLNTHMLYAKCVF